MPTADQSNPTNDTLPPLDSDRITFQVSYQDSTYTKQLLIDDCIVHTLASAREPDDYRVYATYLSATQCPSSAEEYMLKNLTKRQLSIVLSWLREKTEEYTNTDFTIGQGNWSISQIDSDTFKLFNHLVSIKTMARYEPTRQEMINIIDCIAASLEQRQAGKAAKKLRLAGNLIPHDF